MELSLCCLPDDVFIVPGLCDQDPGVLKLGMGSQVCAVLGHG